MSNVTGETESVNDGGRSEFPAPVGRLLGLTLSTPAQGRATIEFEAGERYYNPMGTLHGGVLCDIANAAMGAAYRSALAEGESFTTLELKINFLRPVRKGKLRVEAKMVRAGRGPRGVRCLRPAREARGARLQHVHDVTRRARGEASGAVKGLREKHGLSAAQSVTPSAPRNKGRRYQPMKRLTAKPTTSASPNSNCSCPERAIARLCASASESPETNRT